MTYAQFNEGYQDIGSLDIVRCRRCGWEIDALLVMVSLGDLERHELDAHPRSEILRRAAIEASAVAKLPNLRRAPPFVPSVDEWDLLPDAESR